MGINLVQTKSVENLVKEKDYEIQRIKKKLQIPTTLHPDAPKLMVLQEGKDKIYKEMLLYKDQAIELKQRIGELEKEKVEWMASKASSSHQRKDCTTKDLSRDMSVQGD